MKRHGMQMGPSGFGTSHGTGGAIHRDRADGHASGYGRGAAPSEDRGGARGSEIVKHGTYNHSQGGSHGVSRQWVESRVGSARATHERMGKFVGRQSAKLVRSGSKRDLALDVAHKRAGIDRYGAMNRGGKAPKSATAKAFMSGKKSGWDAWKAKQGKK